MSTRVWAPAVLLLSVLVTGCSQQIEITQYPAFYNVDDPSRNIKSVAVLPFRNQATGPDAAKAGDTIAEKLATRLMASGTYEQVYNPKDLGALLDQQDLKIALGGDPEASAAQFRKIGNVQAILTGAVTSYSGSSHTEMRIKPVTQFNTATGQTIVRMQPMQVTVSEGVVSASATLLRTSDGSTIHASEPPADARYPSESSGPQACLVVASNMVVSKLYQQFAAVRKTVNVRNDAFKTASELYDGKWTYTDTFRASAPKIFVVLRLPDSCDRNRFRITIVRKGTRRSVTLKNIRWKKGNEEYGVGYEFSPREIERKAGGGGAFVAKFYPGPEPKLFAEFNIE